MSVSSHGKTGQDLQAGSPPTAAARSHLGNKLLIGWPGAEQANQWPPLRSGRGRGRRKPAGGWGRAWFRSRVALVAVENWPYRERGKRGEGLGEVAAGLGAPPVRHLLPERLSRPAFLNTPATSHRLTAGPGPGVPEQSGGAGFLNLQPFPVLSASLLKIWAVMSTCLCLGPSSGFSSLCVPTSPHGRITDHLPSKNQIYNPLHSLY